jgi:hypothetical protein
MRSARREHPGTTEADMDASCASHGRARHAGGWLGGFGIRDSGFGIRKSWRARLPVAALVNRDLLRFVQQLNKVH